MRVIGDAVDRWPARWPRLPTATFKLWLSLGGEAQRTHRRERSSVAADARIQTLVPFKSDDTHSTCTPIFIIAVPPVPISPTPTSHDMDSSEKHATKGVMTNGNLSRPGPPYTTPDVTPTPKPTPTTPETPPDRNRSNGGDGAGQTTPPSPFTDTTSSSALALSAYAVSAGTPHTDLTSLPSDVSKLSLGLGPAKKPARPLTEPAPPPAAVAWPYSHSVALDDIPGIAYVLDTFLKSQMVESEEFCHRNDPQKCVVCRVAVILIPVRCFAE